MISVRRLLACPRLVLLLCGAALLLKLLVPAGYMITTDRGGVTMALCSGFAATPMPAMHAAPADHGKSKDHGKAEMPCAFAGLSAGVLAAADPVLIAALIAFVVAAGIFETSLPPVARRAFLRPPLRGPPTPA